VVKTVAFDIDDVVCNMFPEWVREMNQRYGLNNSPDYWPRYNPWEELGVTAEQAFAALVPELYPRSKPYPDAFPAVRALREMGHKVLFLTSCPDFNHLNAKIAWLYQHGFFRNDDACPVIPVGPEFQLKHKSEYPTDFLVDDHVDNLRGRKGGVLLNRPHNRGITNFYGRRVNSLQEFANHVWASDATCDARALADAMSVGGSDF
jgi:5'(3')-deoxyribonucleotidase